VPDTIAELFARNPLEKRYTDEELDRVIAYMRERRKQSLLGKAAPKPKSEKPIGKDPDSLEDLGL
jgi:hypothetical protein